MNIALNCIYCLPGRVGGTQTYAEYLMEGLAEIDTVNRYFVFVNSEADRLRIPDAPNFERIVCPVQPKDLPRRYAFEQFKLPGEFTARKIDVALSLGYVCPLNAPCGNLVTIHDLNYLRHKEAMPFAKRLLFGFFVSMSARRSDHILTVSDFSKQEMVQALGIPERKITTTHLAARRLSESALSPTDMRKRYNLPEQYVIAFSSHSHHKNMPRLLRAFAEPGVSQGRSLVLVGHLPPDDLLRALISDLKIDDKIVITGYVPDEDVMPLLTGADLFVFPSYYEGFGLPLVEAQQAGTAVACSSCGSLPEVAGDGAEMFDAFSIDSIAEAIRRCLADPALREELRRKGAENVKRFSWSKTARTTLEALSMVARKSEKEHRAK